MLLKLWTNKWEQDVQSSWKKKKNSNNVSTQSTSICTTESRLREITIFLILRVRNSLCFSLLSICFYLRCFIVISARTHTIFTDTIDIDTMILFTRDLDYISRAMIHYSIWTWHFVRFCYCLYRVTGSNDR